MIIPYSVDLAHDRSPFANWAIIAVTVLLSAATLANMEDGELPLTLILFRGDAFQPVQLIGNLFTHASFGHLIGNMIFLFCFGNAVNGRMPHWLFVPFYFACGVCANLAWLACGDGEAAIGASGAVMGILGATIMLYPSNHISIFYWFGFVFAGSFALPVVLVGGVYILFDLFGAMSRTDSAVAFIAHLGGAAAGMALMGVLLMTGMVKTTRADRTLLQQVGLMKAPQKAPPRRW